MWVVEDTETEERVHWQNRNWGKMVASKFLNYGSRDRMSVDRRSDWLTVISGPHYQFTWVLELYSINVVV